MLSTLAVLTHVVGKFIGQLHLDPSIPHDIAIEMCDQFIKYLKADKEAKVAAQKPPETNAEAPLPEEPKAE